MCKTAEFIYHLKRSNLLTPGEQIIFHSSVEVRSRRRRLTASLLPAQHKPKIRHLVLTSTRLLVVKVKPGRSVVLKSETFFRPVSKDKEPERKDGKVFVTDVTAKGKNGFIVMTVSVSFYFYPTYLLTL